MGAGWSAPGPRGGGAPGRQEQLQAVLSAVVADDPRGIIVCDGAGRLIEANRAAVRMLSRRHDDPASTEPPIGAGSSLPGDVVDQRGARVPPHELPDAVARRTGQVVADEVLGLATSSDVHRWLAVTAVPVETDEGRWVVTQLRDVTAETTTVVDLQRLAAVDPLTGAGNRRLLEWTVDDLLDPDEEVGVLLLDIDRFKEVNDAHGHAVGDQVLRQIAERIAAVCRPDDVTVRLGGDEFVIVLRRLEERDDALEVVARIARVLQAPFVTDAGLLDVGCSLGWTTGSAVAAQALVGEADRRMYQSKHAAQAPTRGKHRGTGARTSRANP